MGEYYGRRWMKKQRRIACKNAPKATYIGDKVIDWSEVWFLLNSSGRWFTIAKRSAANYTQAKESLSSSRSAPVAYSAGRTSHSAERAFLMAEEPPVLKVVQAVDNALHWLAVAEGDDYTERLHRYIRGKAPPPRNNQIRLFYAAVAFYLGFRADPPPVQRKSYKHYSQRWEKRGKS